MTSPGSSSETSELPPWILASLLATAFGLTGVIWLGGSLGAWVSGGLWQPPPFSLATLLTFLTGDLDRLWPHTSPVAVGAGIVAVAAAGAGTLIPAGLALYRRFKVTPGLAGRRDLRSLTVKGAAARARTLRPSLVGRKHITPDETGMLLGEHDGAQLRGSYEDSYLAFMAPRAGKTTAVTVPMALRAPGAVMMTSRKSDVYTLTSAALRARGQLWAFDPQQICYAPQDFWWDLLAGSVSVEGARRLASNFITNQFSAGERGNFWSLAAANTLAAMFHAAARTGRTHQHVLEWLSDPTDDEPVRLLKNIDARALALSLRRTLRGDPETRNGIYETTGQVVACLADPVISRWITPDPDKPQFDPEVFVHSRDTLYLFSKKGGSGAAPLVAAFVDAVLQAGITAAEEAGGRLDPPLLPILDEAANIVQLDDLPDLYSFLGSMGLPLVTILQSYRQGVRVWGEPGMDALWSAATVKILGAGLDDADFAEKISRLIGDHKVVETSVSDSRSGRSVSRSSRRERIYTAADVRALPRGTGLLLLTGIRAAAIRFRPWMAEPYADRIAAAHRRAQAQITKRARRARQARRSTSRNLQLARPGVSNTGAVPNGTSTHQEGTA
ncbi:type IV secretory system conjugative DNA transfer family protein [Streptosporangium canum]|uniref:type IV secretory system conjugative DNA transfer family protein n=1 Tax=Streptosporangium canum TaxID=324952 RepID=UPI0036C0F860